MRVGATVVGVEQSRAGEGVHGVSRRHAAGTAARRYDDGLRTYLVQVVAARGRW